MLPSASTPAVPLPRSVRSAGSRLASGAARSLGGSPSSGCFIPAVPRRLRTVRAILPVFAPILLLFLAGCRGRPLLEAERAAPVGSEFIRLFADGEAEYGYGVVKENFKARGAYRYARDTVWFLDESFRPHFPAGHLPIKGGVLYMDNGLHFRIKTNRLGG